MKLGQVVQVQNLLGPLCNCEKTVKKKTRKNTTWNDFCVCHFEFSKGWFSTIPPLNLQKVAWEVSFNFRFQNTQNKTSSRQSTLVERSFIPPERVSSVKKYFENVPRQLWALFWWNDAQNRKISLFPKREILRFWASFHQKSPRSCRRTSSKYFLTQGTCSGGITDPPTNVIWRENGLFCVFWKWMLKNISQATFWVI